MKAVREICKRDTRYHPRSYIFMLEALDYTARTLDKPSAKGPERHVSGSELLNGLRVYALEQFGPMAMTVFESWGVRRTEDLGEIVFNLVECGKLRRTDQDSKQDFADGYDFHEAFAKPFLPNPDEPSGAPSTVRRRA